MRIAGIVLAAGRSRRMGSPKALLRLDGRSFLERAVTALREGGCDPVHVVAGPEGRDAETGEIREQARRLGAAVATNPRADSEQVDSLRAGLAALPPDAGAAVVLPVDVPLVGASAVRRVVEAFRRGSAPVVRAASGERHGHPVLFARRVWPELMAGSLPEGARSVIHAHAGEVEEVETDDPRVLVDVDTPADLRRVEGEAGEGHGG